jgi:2-phospho-L-lactate guanylyltransferase
MIALIPVKALARGKSRLAGALDAQARAQLVRDTLRRTVEALKQVAEIAGVYLVTQDPAVAGWAAEWGVQSLRENRSGLNESLEEARLVLLGRAPGAVGLLVLPADLGWLAAEDVRAMIALAGRPPCAVIAPDRRGTGTNALLLRPPDLIAFRFGLDSARAHAGLAAERGAAVVWYRSSTVSLDVDEPDDLSLYYAAPYVM